MWLPQGEVGCVWSYTCTGFLHTTILSSPHACWVWDMCRRTCSLILTLSQETWKYIVYCTTTPSHSFPLRLFPACSNHIQNSSPILSSPLTPWPPLALPPSSALPSHEPRAEPAGPPHRVPINGPRFTVMMPLLPYVCAAAALLNREDKSGILNIRIIVSLPLSAAVCVRQRSWRCPSMTKEINQEGFLRNDLKLHVGKKRKRNSVIVLYSYQIWFILRFLPPKR